MQIVWDNLHETICMKWPRIFWEKHEKYFKMSSAEITQNAKHKE